MKNFYNYFLKNTMVVALVVLIFNSSAAQIESSSASYYVIQYHKVEPNMENEYLKLEFDIWKKMHQARIEKDILDGWFLFRVISPTGSKTEYNFVTALAYDNAEKLAGHFEAFGVDYTSVLDAEEISQALNTPNIRELVYEEVWKSIDVIMKKDPEKMYRFQVFNAMKMRDNVAELEYQRIEKEYWKPMHEYRIGQNKLHGWGIYNMIIPGGTEREYHWATVDFYDNFIDIMADNGMIFEKIHGKKKAEKYTEETVTSRDLLKIEVRELLDYINDETIDP